MDLFSKVIGGIGTGILFYPLTTNEYELFKDHNGITKRKRIIRENI